MISVRQQPPWLSSPIRHRVIPGVSVAYPDQIGSPYLGNPVPERSRGRIYYQSNKENAKNFRPKQIKFLLQAQWNCDEKLIRLCSLVYLVKQNYTTACRTWLTGKKENTSDYIPWLELHGFDLRSLIGLLHEQCPCSVDLEASTIWWSPKQIF